MEKRIFFVMLGLWFLFMILAIINAILRNVVYKPIIGELYAHQISTIIFISMILIATYLVFRFIKLELTDSQAVIIGTVWIITTICFEFIAGHYLFGNSWDKLLADYNILKGRIWSLVLITIFFAPYLMNKLI